MCESNYETIKANLSQSFTKQEVRAVCLSGPWGVGKTHAWNEALSLAKKENNLFGRNYSYISLFGISSIDQLKTAIIQNTTSNILSEDDTFRSLISELATGKSSTKRVGAKLLSGFRKTSDAAATLPYIKNFSSLISPAFFYYIKDQIICFDDLERAGEGLKIRDIFGLISQLCEQKNCKCFLILNDDELGDQAADFSLFFEKTFDRRLVLSPDPHECCEIALRSNSSTWGNFFREIVINIGMTNIRIIRKTLYLCIDFDEIVGQGIDNRIFEECIKTLIVASWCVFMPKSAPPAEFISLRKTRRLRQLFDRVQNRTPEPETEKEKDWNIRLEKINFGHSDDLRSLLFESVESGFFKTGIITEILNKITAELAAQDKQSSFNSAWEIYHDSLNNNQVEFAQALHNSALLILKDILPVNLDNTITILRELDRDDLADNLIDSFERIPIAELKRTIKLRKGHPTESVSDNKLQDAYRNIAARSLNSRTVDQAVFNFVTGNFDGDDIFLLDRISDKEAIEILHDLRGPSLRSFASNLSFLNDTVKSINGNVHSKFVEAFDKISKESKINERRVDNLRSLWNSSDKT